jgi:hypothetical protein
VERVPAAARRRPAGGGHAPDQGPDHGLPLVSRRVEAGGAFEEGAASNLWLLEADGSRPRRLTSFTADRVFGFNWMPDGRAVVLTAGIATTDAVLIREFRRAVRGAGWRRGHERGPPWTRDAGDVGRPKIHAPSVRSGARRTGMAALVLGAQEVLTEEDLAALSAPAPAGAPAWRAALQEPVGGFLGVPGR